MSPGLGLIIHHNIYLTRQQRYDLSRKKEVRCVGMSTAVWCQGKVTSEPAKEIFCDYTLRNIGEDFPVAMNAKGYDICLPNRAKRVRRISNERWRAMDEAGRDAFYEGFRDGITCKNLVDLGDGGSECLKYSEHCRVLHTDGTPIIIIHLIQIRDIGVLESSISITPGWVHRTGSL